MEPTTLTEITKEKKKICRVCKQNIYKYKCPTCETPYCSLKCYKQHKEIPCLKSIENQLKSIPEEKIVENSIVPDENSLVLNEEILSRLSQSKDVKNSLNNGDLRKILMWITNSNDPHEAIHTAMMEPIFVDFVDECLNLVEEKETLDLKRLKTN